MTVDHSSYTDSTVFLVLASFFLTECVLLMFWFNDSTLELSTTSETDMFGVLTVLSDSSCTR